MCRTKADENDVLDEISQENLQFFKPQSTTTVIITINFLLTVLY